MSVHIYGKFILYKSRYVRGKFLMHIICSFCVYAAFIDETPGLYYNSLVKNKAHVK